MFSTDAVLVFLLAMVSMPEGLCEDKEKLGNVGSKELVGGGVRLGCSFDEGGADLETTRLSGEGSSKDVMAEAGAHGPRSHGCRHG